MPAADGGNEKSRSSHVRKVCGGGGGANLRSIAVSGLFDSFSVGEFGGEVSFQWVVLNQFDSNELHRKSWIE
jgi:hypothetical protein